MSDQKEYENLLAEVEEYLSKVNIPNPSEEEKKSLDLMKKQLEKKIDSRIELEQKTLDSLNSLLQNINDGEKLYNTEKKEETGKTADVSTKEMEELEQISKNINSTKENLKKSAEDLSKNIEKWKKIKDKISKSNETNEKKD